LSLEGGISLNRAHDLELVQIISQFPNKNAKIGSSMLQILEFFVTKPYLSTYQIQKALQQRGKNIKHEKIRDKVKKLASLKLIEIVRSEELRPRELMHGAVYYKLTLSGIFYFLYEARHVLPFLKPAGLRNFIRHHGNNILFRTFLYPYLEGQTFSDIRGIVTIQEIFTYLYRCCDATLKIIALLEEFKDESQWTMPLFDWNSIPGQYDKGIIMFLHSEFDLNLSGHIRLEKIDEGQTLRILDDKNAVALIRLDKDKEDRAFLICSDKRQYELVVERSANKLMICIPSGTPKEHLVKKFADQIDHNVMSLVFSLVVRFTDLDVLKDVEISDHDWRVLLHDMKFMRLLEKSSKSYQEKITQIMNLK
jgi:hypothetical protein